MRNYRLFIAVFAAVCGVFAAKAADEEYSEDITLTSVTNLTVASGNTLTWSGKISGSGGIKLSGGGTLVLSHADNDFEGGVELTASTARADASMAFGTGLLKLVKRFDAGNHFVFNASGGVFSNDVDLASTSACYENAPTILCLASATLHGNVTGSGNSDFFIKTGPDSSHTGYLLTIEGTVTVNKALCVNTWGSVVFCKTVSCNALTSPTTWSQTGSITLMSSENSIPAFSLGTSSIICGDTNVLGISGSATWANTTTWNDQMRSRIELNGFPQSIGSLSSKYAPNYTASHKVFSTGKAAKLTLTGDTTNKSTSYLFTENVELELNAANADFEQELIDRPHTSTQPLTVTSGTLKLAGATTFAGVPSITVGENGTLKCAATNANANAVIFAAATKLVLDGKLVVEEGKILPFRQNQIALELGSNAEITMPAAADLAVTSLKVNGETVVNGVHQFGNVRILVTGGNPVWKGGAADDKVTTGGNWDIGRTPDLYSGFGAVKFATGGTKATLDTSINVKTFTLDAPNGFTFEKTADETISSAQGLAFTGVEGTANTYTFKPTFIDGGSVAETWTIPASNVVDFAGGLVVTNNKITITKPDAGKLCIRDGSILSGGLRSEKGELYVTGLIATPGHVDQGWAGNNENTLGVGLAASDSTAATRCYLMLDNAVIEKPTYACSQGGTGLKTVANTTNEIRGAFVSANPSQSFYVNGKDGVLRFKGGITPNCSLTVHGGGTVEIYDHPTRENVFTSLYAYGTKLVFKGTRNRIYTKLNFEGGSNGIITFEKNYAFIQPMAMLFTGYWWGDSDSTNTIDLAGTVQQAKIIMPRVRKDGSFDHKNAFIGGEGSMMEITEGGTNSIWVSGAVSFKMSGSKYLLISHRKSSTTGKLIVDKGEVEFGLGAAWPNASRVEVNNNAKLTLDDGSYFGENTDLVFTGNGLLSMKGEEMRIFKSATVNGEEIEIGKYTYATAPESLKAHLDPNMQCLIKVGKRGTTLILF